MYRATTSFTTNDYDVRYKEILEDDFTTPEEIQEFLNIGYIEVYDDTLEITQNGEYDVEDYKNADVDVLTFPPNWSEIGYTNTPQEILNGFNYAKEIYDNWDMSLTDLTNAYKRDTKLKFFPAVDMSNITTLGDTFAYCNNLINVELKNTIKLNSLAGAFSYSSIERINPFYAPNLTWLASAFKQNSNLKHLPKIDTSKISNQGLILFVQNCSGLTDESLNNILEMCINATKYTSQYKTLAHIGLSSSQATRCQSLSNWDAFVEAGWSTGY